MSFELVLGAACLLAVLASLLILDRFAGEPRTSDGRFGTASPDGWAEVVHVSQLSRGVGRATPR